ncbi:MAG: Rhs family protein, partial [Rickettsiaceae bacterium]|nr:Rhs family protein [Rickettsiaceae bacterium]
DPSNSQCLNRYSYCNNNPIAAVDPSGFSWFSDLWDSIRDAFKDIFHGIGQALRNPVVSSILEIAVGALMVAAPGALAGLSMFTRFAMAAEFNGIVSYAQTGSIGIGLRTAAFTLMNEYAWAATGTALDTAQAATAERTLTHGIVGGGLSAIEGGNFKNGFLSAAVSQAMAGQMARIDITGSQTATIMSRGLAAGVVGGTVAAATGGNFENGMMTSAFGEMFNDCLQGQDQRSCNAQKLAEYAEQHSGLAWGSFGSALVIGISAPLVAFGDLAGSMVSGITAVWRALKTDGAADVDGLSYAPHAVERMEQRGISTADVESLVNKGESFNYYHDGEWKLGYYNSDSQLFVAQSQSGKVITVINNVSKNYINNLRNSQP